MKALLLPLLVSLAAAGAMPGSEKTVHYWFMPSEVGNRVAGAYEVFNEYEPQCVNISAQMYPCTTLQYKTMRMPNLLKQQTVSEAASFISGFAMDSFMQCDPHAKDFLCSLAAPVCFDPKPFMRIYPCKSLCERVKNNCIGQLRAFGNQIPGNFNCSQFEDNNLCMDPLKNFQFLDSASSSNNPAPPAEREPDIKENPTAIIPVAPKPVSPVLPPVRQPTESTRFVQGDSFLDVREALCYGSPIKLVIRGRLKLMRKKRQGFYMKLREKKMKIFLDRDEDIVWSESGLPLVSDMPLDDYFYRSFPAIDADDSQLPLKKDVVYFFVSEYNLVPGDRFLRVQYAIADTGDSGRLRREVNKARDPVDCREYRA
uniref:Secreted frizzled related protein Sfrp1a n=1 Tax=Isodiametra pulchra TaxID=504439 RepID=A0A2P1DV95_ISOPU|nr:secreted frizzled related protein Sfrp1a [Isodiametra pulchra]